MVSLNIIINSKYITILNVLTMIFFSFICYFGFLVYVHYSTMFNSCASMYVTFTSSLVYFNLIVVSGLTSAIDFCLYSGYLNFSNSVTCTLMKERKEKSVLENYHELPKLLQKFVRIYKRMSG